MKKNAAMDTKEKILEAASDLFYFQGYENTGIQEIIDRCKITKPALYYYFPGKADLGRAYLEIQEERFLATLKRSFERSTSLQGFFKSWTGYLKLAARKGVFIGCPFMGFTAQMKRFKDRDFYKHLMRTKNRSIDLLSEILGTYHPELSPEETDMLIHEIMALHAGNTQLYRMTGDISYIERFRNQLERICMMK